MFGFDFILTANLVFLSTGTVEIQRHAENEKAGTVEMRVHLN